MQTQAVVSALSALIIVAGIAPAAAQQAPPAPATPPTAAPSGQTPPASDKDFLTGLRRIGVLVGQAVQCTPQADRSHMIEGLPATVANGPDEVECGGKAKRYGDLGAQLHRVIVNRANINRQNFNSNNFRHDVTVNRNVNVNGGCCSSNWGPNWGGVAAGAAIGVGVAAAGAAVANAATYPPPPPYPYGYPYGYPPR